MNIGDLPTSTVVSGWVGVMLVLALGMLRVRAKGSSDATQRAKDAADAGIYSRELAEMKIDRNGWRDAYRDIEKHLRESQALAARQSAQIEAQSLQIEQLRQQMAGLRSTVKQLANDDQRKALGPDFARTDPGRLDEHK